MFTPEFSLPGTVVAVGVTVGVVAYALAPEVGERLAVNSGAIAACERRLVADLARTANRQSTAVGGPGLDVGSVLRGVFAQYPGGTAYLNRYGGQLNAMADGLTAPIRAAAAKQKEAIAEQFALKAAAGESVCACRARVAINKAHSTLAVFTATGGLVAWSPVDDWPAAMAAPDVIAQCKEVS